jgi:hypothetical protein
LARIELTAKVFGTELVQSLDTCILLRRYRMARMSKCDVEMPILLMIQPCLSLKQAPGRQSAISVWLKEPLRHKAGAKVRSKFFGIRGCESSDRLSGDHYNFGEYNEMVDSTQRADNDHKPDMSSSSPELNRILQMAGVRAANDGCTGDFQAPATCMAPGNYSEHMIDETTRFSSYTQNVVSCVDAAPDELLLGDTGPWSDFNLRKNSGRQIPSNTTHYAMSQGEDAVSSRSRASGSDFARSLEQVMTPGPFEWPPDRSIDANCMYQGMTAVYRDGAEQHPRWTPHPEYAYIEGQAEHPRTVQIPLIMLEYRATPAEPHEERMTTREKIQ